MINRSHRPLWWCPKCGRRFANGNQSHSCGRYDLESHFAGKPAKLRAIFDAVLLVVRRCGPVTVLPQKTRIAFQIRMSFAQATFRARWMDGHVVLGRRLEHPRFRRIDTISPQNHVHHFRLTAASEVDVEVEAWLREAYSIGEQKHLGRVERGGLCHSWRTPICRELGQWNALKAVFAASYVSGEHPTPKDRAQICHICYNGRTNLPQ
jgi:hypothetical protein